MTKPNKRKIDKAGWVSAHGRMSVDGYPVRWRLEINSAEFVEELARDHGEVAAAVGKTRAWLADRIEDPLFVALHDLLWHLDDESDNADGSLTDSAERDVSEPGDATTCLTGL